jgi:hypothetical protein
MHVVSKLKLANKFEALGRKMLGFSIFPLGGCFDGCRVGIWYKDLEPKRPAGGAANKSGINIEEGSYFKARVFKETEMQEHIQGLYAWKKWEWGWRNEELAVLL